MFNFHLPTAYEVAIMLPAIVLGLTLHEYAHALVADRLGDKTPRFYGRLTLNPLAHVDIIGLLMLFLVGFGWARPVPVEPFNFRGDWRRGMLLVSLAGPLANILLALTGAVLLGFKAFDLPYGQQMAVEMMRINAVLAVFNLLPVPPLDGSKILAGLFPRATGNLWRWEAYGTLVLLFLLFTGLIGKILGWIISPFFKVLIHIARLVDRVF